MDILLSLVMAAGGIAMLCFGADRLVSGASSVAKRLGVSGFVIGLTVVALGTSAPELAASVAAAMSGQTDIILGNVVGSNIANVGMVIGAAAILGGAVIARRTLRREIPLMLGFCALLALVSADGVITQWDGVVLLACLIGFMVWALRRRPPPDGGPTGPDASGHVKTVVQGRRRFAPYCMVVLGVGCLWVGSLLAIEGVVAAAEWFGVSGRVIGMVVIAVGTSMPELVTTVQSIRRRAPDVGVANIIGSNIINVLMIVGVSSAITQIAVWPVMFVDYAVMCAFGACLFMAWRGAIPKMAGVGLVGGYVAYLAVSVLT